MTFGMPARCWRWRHRHMAKPSSTRTPPALPPTTPATGKPDEDEEAFGDNCVGGGNGGDGGDDGGGGGGGGGGGEAISIMGTASTAMPSCVVAAAAVPRLVESEACNADTVVEAGTTMMAVMRTEAAATVMVTSDVSTPAASATLCRKLEVSE